MFEIELFICIKMDLALKLKQISKHFTMEKEKDNKSLFIDVLITRTDQGFSTSMYWKSFFTRQYLNFNYHHLYNIRKGIIHCLQHQAKAINGNYVQGAYDKFPDFFFVWALLLIVHTWNSSPLRSNLLRLQCTCTVPTRKVNNNIRHKVFE